ncbi:MAG: hypothetical protein ACRC37_02325 [Lentisphaeria bacterium]
MNKKENVIYNEMIFDLEFRVKILEKKLEKVCIDYNEAFDKNDDIGKQLSAIHQIKKLTNEMQVFILDFDLIVEKEKNSKMTFPCDFGDWILEEANCREIIGNYLEKLADINGEYLYAIWDEKYKSRKKGGSYE